MTKENYASYSIDNETKKEAQRIIKKLGFTPSSLMTILYEKIIEDKKIPFDISQYHKDQKVVYMCRIEKKVKDNAEKIIKASGLTPSLLLNMFYNEIIKRKGLPFEVKSKIDPLTWQQYKYQLDNGEK